MQSKRILVFGNLGYIGPVLARQLRSDIQNVEIVGYDMGYFDQSYSMRPATAEAQADIQHYGDVRDPVNRNLFQNVDAVIYLAAISNDPMGRRFSRQTHAINCDAAVECAHQAKMAGVKSFVFASSCSVYGAGGAAAKDETAPLEPLTDYAKSKVQAEAALRPIATPDFSITCLRFATACGASPRLRLDLVLNDFVAAAIHDRKIKILSDGTPLRPLIDVRDMSKAMIWAAQRPATEGGGFLILNAGSNKWNFSVREIAEAVVDYYGDVGLDVSSDAPADSRSYRVDFDRFREMGHDAYPTREISNTIADLDTTIRNLNADLQNFRDGPLIRFNALGGLINTGKLTDNLQWA